VLENTALHAVNTARDRGSHAKCRSRHKPHTNYLFIDSSPIELIPTPATIPGTPNSPSLLPSPDSRNSFARRRLNWGRADSAGPVAVHPPPAMNDPGLSSSRPSTSSQPIPNVYALDDDPFVASIPRANLDDPCRPSITSHYDDPDPFAYLSNPHACASSTFLTSTS
jgi:hypothetical protein